MAGDLETGPIEVAGPVVPSEHPDSSPWVRHPGDAICLLAALLAVLVSGLILDWGSNTAAGLQETSRQCYRCCPRWL